MKKTARWRILAILSVAECLAISLWMTATAVTPALTELWKLNASQAGLLMTAVQLGFVAGAAGLAVTNFADTLNNRKLFFVSAILAAGFNGLITVCDSFHVAVLWRFLTGVFLAGVYPPAMKMIATWFQQYRGLAIGTLVGALTLGKALPWLIKLLGGGQWQVVTLVASGAAVVGGVLVLVMYREGPHTFERRPFELSLVREVWLHRPTRLAIFGYLGHMWELYAMWTWVPTFLAVAAERSGVDSSGLVQLGCFATIAAGAVGCVAGGFWADRIGRDNVVNGSMLVSGICCLIAGLFLGLPFWMVVLMAVIWGAFVVADSAQFSAMVTEVAPRHAVGTALAMQTSLGFLLTTVTIQLLPIIQGFTGWRFAFAFLAFGPLFGIWSIRAWRTSREQNL